MLRRALLPLLFVFLAGCSRPQQTALTILPSAPNQAAKIESRGEDRSAEFLRRFDDLQIHPADKVEGLANYHVLVVHGLLGEVGLKFTRLLDKIDINQHLIDYFKDANKCLRTAGVDAEILEHKSQSVACGGEAVARCILASDRPVLILSHSKGGLDTLEALCILQREGKLSKVAGWIAMQGPFKGAPEADRIAGDSVRRVATRVALNCLGARSDAVKDMTTSAREAYFGEHREEIERIVKAVPVLCFASLKPDAKDAGTDGSVPLESAKLPGADFVAVNGLSHSAAVMSKPHEFNREALTRALFAMLLERVQPAAEVVTALPASSRPQETPQIVFTTTRR